MKLKHGLRKQVALAVGLSKQTISEYIRNDPELVKRLNQLDYIHMNYPEFMLSAKQIVQKKYNERMKQGHKKPRVL